MTTKQLRKAVGRENRARVCTDFQFREVADGSGGSRVHFTGYASTTDDPYEVNDWIGSYTETMARGCFLKTVAERDDAKFLFNHDGVPMASVRGATMTLTEDERGLLVDAPDLDAASPLVQTVRSAMERGDLDAMSFAFSATRQEWNEDYTARTVREVRLYDVSVVTYPANPGTIGGAGLRALDVADHARVAAIAADLRAGKTLSAATITTLTAVLDTIVAADEGLDAAAADLSMLLGVENPDPEADSQNDGDAGEQTATGRSLALALAQRARS